MKGRRRSPVPSRKHGERSEKSGASTSGMSTATLLGTPAGPNPGSNPHLSPAVSGNLALPATPSTQSLSLSGIDERNLHISSMSATPTTLTGSIDGSGASAATLTSVKTADEQSLLDEDPVIWPLFFIFLEYVFINLCMNSPPLLKEMSYFSSGGDGANVLLDELDGAGGSISGMPPGTPEFNKIRLEMEHIQVSVFGISYV